MSDNTYLGIPDERKSEIKDFIELSADLDFWHDFNHGDKAKMDAVFFNSFAVSYQQKPNSKETDKAEFVDNVRKLQKKVIGLKNTTFWSFFSKEAPITTILPSTDFFGRMGADEDNIIDEFIWQQFDETSSKSLALLKVKINSEYKAHKDKPHIINDKVKIRIGPKIIKSQGRLADNSKTPVNDYDIKVFPNRYQGNKVSIIRTLCTLSEPGTKNFIFLIDATNLGISSIRKNFKKDYGTNFNENDTYNIYIISSLENESDPAGKIGSIDNSFTPKDLEEDTTADLYAKDKINVFFLVEDDKSYNSNFPVWTDSNKNSLLYSKCNLRTFRNPDGKIACQVRLPNNTTIEHKDLGSISKIREAGYAMVRKYLEYNSKPLPDQRSEISHYYLLKRAGDWCQALCLLDRDRIYRVKDEKFKDTDNKFSINQFLTTNPNTEVALLTHDRVLLSYALQLGLNVLFSVLFTGEDKTIVQIYFKNQKSKNKEFRYELLLNQVNSILKQSGKDTYSIADIKKTPMDTTGEKYISTLQNMIATGASNIDVAKINASISESNSKTNIISSKINMNMEAFETDLPTYFGRLRLLFYIGTNIEKDIKLIEVVEKPDIDTYVSSISKTLDKLENNKGLIESLNHIDEIISGSKSYLRPTHFAEEYEGIQRFCKLVKERTDFIRSASTGVQRDWINFENTVLRQLLYDSKLLGLKAGDFIPVPKGSSPFKGLKMLHQKLMDTFPDMTTGGGPLDVRLTKLLLNRTINTTPLNILRIPSNSSDLLLGLKNAYGSNPEIERIATLAYTNKLTSLYEPQLSDYCNDFIDFIMDKNIGLATINEGNIQVAFAEFDKEGLYLSDNKVYVERGTKLVDIAEHYNTVVDDYIIDSTNDDGFRYIYDKVVGNQTFEFNNNYNVLAYRFLIYYLDRLSEKIVAYQVGKSDDNLIAFEDQGYQKTVLELYLINITMSNVPQNILGQMKYYFGLDETEYNIPKPAPGESNFYYNCITDVNINASIEALELDIKRKQIVCIFNYYNAKGYKDLNSQVLESLIYNLCANNKKTVIDIFSALKNGQINVAGWNDKILQATIVTYLILSVYDIVDPISDINKLFTIDATIAKKLYARAIRFCSNNSWAAGRLKDIIEKSKLYFIGAVSSDEHDYICEIAVLAYANRDENLLSRLVLSVNTLPRSSLNKLSILMEILGIFIKICYIVEPDKAKNNGYYIFLDKPIIISGTDTFKISVEEFNTMINKLLQDNNVDIRANFEDSGVSVGGKRSTIKRRYRKVKNKAI